MSRDLYHYGMINDNLNKPTLLALRWLVLNGYLTINQAHTIMKLEPIEEGDITMDKKQLEKMPENGFN